MAVECWPADPAFPERAFLGLLLQYTCALTFDDSFAVRSWLALVAMNRLPATLYSTTLRTVQQGRMWVDPVVQQYLLLRV